MFLLPILFGGEEIFFISFKGSVFSLSSVREVV